MYINMYGSANYGYDATTYAALEQLGIARNDHINRPSRPRQRLLCELHPHGSIVLNLFVGVMLTGMDDARKETELAEAAKRKASEDTDIKQELIQMEKQLQEMSQKLSQNLLILSQKAEENSDKINKMLSKDDK